MLQDITQTPRLRCGENFSVPDGTKTIFSTSSAICDSPGLKGEAERGRTRAPRPHREARQRADSLSETRPLQLFSLDPAYFARGSGRSWKCTTFEVWPFPPSMCVAARSENVDHRPLPFHPMLASSMRPSMPLAK